jgi:hypothetical protein
MQAKIFPTMQDIGKEYLKEDAEFLSEIPVLVFGYIYAELVKK